MSAFDRLERMASRSVDRLNAEVFTLIPMKREANGRSTRDEARPIIEARGIFDRRVATPSLQFDDRRRGGGNDFRALVNDRVIQMSVDRRWFCNAVGAPIPDAAPQQSDLVRLTSRDGAPEYSITSAQPDGHSRIVLILSGARDA